MTVTLIFEDRETCAEALYNAERSVLLMRADDPARIPVARFWEQLEEHERDRWRAVADRLVAFFGRD